MNPTPRRAHAGMTLIELMVAVAVFAVLGVLCWSGLSRLADGQAGLAAELERWRAIDRALQRIETRLLQVAAYSTPPGQRLPPALQHDPAAGTAALQFQALAEDGPRREAFALADGALVWQCWPGREAEGAAESDRLLAGARRLAWRFLAGDTLAGRWPPAGGALDRLPAAVELELELDDVGRISRVFALR
jgi:general secretion pathway protein J